MIVNAFVALVTPMTRSAAVIRRLRLPALALSSAALAGSLPATARGEIDALLARLETSQCQFNRNGTWYAPAKAREHLLRKLAYLEDKGLVESAGQFIERGASESSMTGRKYLVKCGNDPPVESRVWLTTQLESIRRAVVPLKPKA